MELNLGISFDLLKNSYKTIDIRAFVVNTSKTEFNWKGVYLTIRLTEDNLEELKQIHKQKEDNLGKIDEENFKILYEAKTIDHFTELIKDINQKHLKIDSINFSIDGSSLKDILESNIILEDDIFFNNSNKSIFVICRQISGNYLYKVLMDLNVPFSELIPNDEDISKWFDMINPVKDASLIITMPIFLIERSLTKKEQKHFLKKFYIHNALKFNCKIQLTPYNHNIEQKNHNVESQNVLIDQKQNSKFIDDCHSYFYIPIPKSKFSLKKYSIQLVIQNKSLIYYNKPIYYEYPKRKKRTTLLETCKLFEGYDKLSDYFFARKGDREAVNVSSIANILTIVGFKNIILSKMGEKVKGKDSTADIIAYDDKAKSLILIDCTTGPKISDKINTMLNLMEDVKDKIDFIPVIITNKSISFEDIESSKNNYNIKIISKEKITYIIELISKDEITTARDVAIETFTS